eukprot:308290-Prymnesium_polylepis.1
MPSGGEAQRSHRYTRTNGASARAVTRSCANAAGRARALTLMKVSSVDLACRSEFRNRDKKASKCFKTASNETV